MRAISTPLVIVPQQHQLERSKRLSVAAFRPISLPVEGDVSGQKSSLPYTSFALKNIREQSQEREDIYDPCSAPCPVGGTYTMVDPLRHLRQARNAVVGSILILAKASC